MKTLKLITLILLFSTNANAGSFSHLNNELPKIDESKEIQDKAVELESVLISKMIEPMFPDGKESNLFGGGHGNSIFRQMMIDEYAKGFAESGGLGLAENIEKDLER